VQQRCTCPDVHVAGLSLEAMCTCLVHAGYFLLGAVLLTFLRSPAISRATLLVTVTLNAAAEVNQQLALDFRGLCLLLLTLTLGTAEGLFPGWWWGGVSVTKGHFTG